MSLLLVAAYAAGALFGLVAGALATVTFLLRLLEQVDQATTLPAPVEEPSADVIDLAGRRSTQSWSA